MLHQAQRKENDHIVITINDDESELKMKQKANSKSSKTTKLIKGAIISFVVGVALLATLQYFSSNDRNQEIIKQLTRKIMTFDSGFQFDTFEEVIGAANDYFKEQHKNHVDPDIMRLFVCDFKERRVQVRIRSAAYKDKIERVDIMSRTEQDLSDKEWEDLAEAVVEHATPFIAQKSNATVIEEHLRHDGRKYIMKYNGNGMSWDWR